MEKNEKIWLIGGGIILMIGFLLINTPKVKSACIGWGDDLYGKYNSLSSEHELYLKTHYDVSKDMVIEWMGYQRELYQYGIFCYGFGARIVDYA